MSDRPPDDLFSLTVSRRIDATPEDVFRAWTDPEQFKRWFQPTRVIMNPGVDGLYFIEVLHEQRSWPHYGRYVRVQRPRLLEFTWMSEGTRGRESMVTVELAPSDGRTKLVLTHAGLPDDEMGRQHEEGWTQILGNLADHLGHKRVGGAAETAPRP